ncbi:LysR family transcriptional regulator [Arthrobacter sp. CAU 1506]|nr:LysR family transcriptional regulator [Arthrobacter sp. CAU 1506]
MTPGKWTRRWAERLPDVPLTAFQCGQDEQTAILRDGRADLSFVRIPVDREGLNVIPLYTELPVVVAPKEHEIALYDDEVPYQEIAAENFLDPEEMGGAKTGIEVVASGGGLMILPMSVARLYNRKDVVYRTVTDQPETQIGLAWLADRTDAAIEEFIGIVRGRTARSSRQPSVQEQQEKTKGRKTSKTSKNTAQNDGGAAGKGANAGKGSGGRRQGGSGPAAGKQSGKGKPGGGRTPKGRGPRRGRR